MDITTDDITAENTLAKTRKVTPEELIQLKTVKQRMNQVITELGQTSIAEINLDIRREKAETFYQETKELQSSLIKLLTDKYGDGNIDLETGEISK
jgi:hypothetical protein